MYGSQKLSCDYINFILNEYYGIKLSKSTLYSLMRNLKAVSICDSGIQQDDSFSFNMQDVIRFIESLDSSLVCSSCENIDNIIEIYVTSTVDSAVCPYCGAVSKKVWYSQDRWFLDKPLGAYPARIWLTVRQFLCCNKECSVNTFREQFSFLDRYSNRSKRLKAMMNSKAK